ncbi:MAG: hypothetical protein HUU25_05675 [Candidatus Sumerlaeia bacterium]|nr:hypothetical protein [Candidatus Sumerlaeia bacterium]
MPDKQELAEQTLHALGIPVQESYFSTGSTVTADGWHAALDAAQAMRRRMDQARAILEREAAADAALAGRLREAIELLKAPGHRQEEMQEEGG